MAKKKQQEAVKELEGVEEKEISDEFVDKKEKKQQSLISKIIWTIIWILIFVWAGMLLFDYYNVSQEKEPKFCIKKEIIEYPDGSVDVCTGLGYKVYHYERESFNAREFGPFWIEDRSAKNNAEK